MQQSAGGDSPRREGSGNLRTLDEARSTWPVGQQARACPETGPVRRGDQPRVPRVRVDDDVAAAAIPSPPFTLVSGSRICREYQRSV